MAFIATASKPAGTAKSKRRSDGKTTSPARVFSTMIANSSASTGASPHKTTYNNAPRA